ncbi:MAG: Zn-dependent oligopeptidase [Deltaproteobacteria bacterium]|nr:Zn-dependent oligopeptidase [Deltaproteobacteria bacterium]
MHCKINILILVLVGTVHLSCGGSRPYRKIISEKKVEVAPDKAIFDDAWRVTGKLAVPKVFQNADEVSARCQEGMDAARAMRDNLVNATAKNPLGVMTQMNRLDGSLDALLPFMELMANVHPQKPIRDAAEQCRQEAMALMTELSLDTEIYRVLASIDADALSPLAQRSLKKQLRAYQRSGVDKDEPTRKRIEEIQKQMVQATIEFSREIREGTRYVHFSESELAGLPSDFIAAHPKSEDGKIKISTDYPDFFPVVNYATAEETRRQVYRAFLQRAWPANEKNLMTILTLRAEFAKLLGFETWADYAAEMEMAKNASNIATFIDEVAKIARPRMEKDLAELLARKQQDIPDATTVNVWDRFYYVNQIKSERFGIDAEALRQYFPFRQVLDGVLKINQILFGVRFEVVADAEVWADDVVAYDVFSGDQHMGRFYLDMHPRDGKYKHMAMFHMVEGIRDEQLPVGALVCNFPTPDDKSTALMEHSDVVTLFHEFGHLMHHILAGGYPYLNMTGISCESEFVEAPSQLLEEWAYDASVLSQFAHHVMTGNPIPNAMVEKLNEARQFGKGIHVMRQMFYAAMSLQYHVVPPSELRLQELTRKLQQQYNPYPFEEDTYVYASFGHLTGYTSEYYSYMWSLKLAKDLLTRFHREGMLNPATAADYRKFVIRKGGAVDATEMVEQFLGRKTSFDAFRDYLEN